MEACSLNWAIDHDYVTVGLIEVVIFFEIGALGSVADFFAGIFNLFRLLIVKFDCFLVLIKRIILNLLNLFDHVSYIRSLLFEDLHNLLLLFEVGSEIICSSLRFSNLL